MNLGGLNSGYWNSVEQLDAIIAIDRMFMLDASDPYYAQQQANIDRLLDRRLELTTAEGVHSDDNKVG